MTMSNNNESVDIRNINYWNGFSFLRNSMGTFISLVYFYLILVLSSDRIALSFSCFICHIICIISAKMKSPNWIADYRACHLEIENYGK